MSTTTGSPSALPSALIRRYPLAQRALWLLPLLAVAGPFASIKPGASGFPYFYRILWAVLALVAIPLAVTPTIRKRTIPRAFTLLIVWWVLWTPITLLWTPARSVGTTEILASSLSMIGAWVVLILSRGTSESLRLLRLGWIAAFVVNTLIVIWEYVTGYHLVSETGVQEWVYSAYSVAGTFSNPNNLSNFTVAALAVMTAQFVRGTLRQSPPYDDLASGGSVGETTAVRRHRRQQLVLGVGMALGVVQIYLTGSRAGMLAATLILIGGAVWCLPKRWRSAAPAVLVLLALGGHLLTATSVNELRPPVGYWAVDPSKRPTHHKEPTSAAEAEIDNSAADALRKELSLSGLRSFKAQPLKGNGAGAAITTVRDDPLYDADATPENRQWHIINLHNTFLEIGVNYGLIGLLAPLGYLGLLLVRAWRPRWIKARWPDPNVLEFLGILLAIAVTSVIASSALGDPTFWLLFAYAGVLSWNDEDARGTRPRAAPLDPAAQPDAHADGRIAP